MSATSLRSILRGPFVFLRPDLPELHGLLGAPSATLPTPQRIFLENEEATPIRGFPILQSAGARALREAAEAYIRAEEELELSLARSQSLDRRAIDAAWSYYRKLLARASENAVSSSFGRGYPSIFWLYHSIAISRLLKESPVRVRRMDLELGRALGNEIKYRIFHRYVDRALEVTYEIVGRVAEETEEEEKTLFPAVLDRMRDNVLLLTEDHVSPDLSELTSYFNGYLRLDGNEFRRRLDALRSWHAEEIARSPRLRNAVRRLLHLSEDSDAASLFHRPGYVTFLAEQPGYPADELLPPEWAPAWENLLLKLKEFELVASLRRFVVPIFEGADGRLLCSAAAIGMARQKDRDVALSVATRPLDFMAPWVIDPRVERYGLIYDITDFSDLISTLGRSSPDQQDRSFRGIFAFQRRVNKMATAHRLRLEKYLGDGALYSGRHPYQALAAAIRLQRHYSRAVQADFPFNRGMRIALNYGRYRLLPIEEEGKTSDHRYEFFGHGIVEVSRLVTGKTLREIEDVKTLLISRGYAPREVEDFFSPIDRQSVYLVDKLEESRQFYAYVTPNGVLVNEGIVSTRNFIAELDQWYGEGVLAAAQDGQRSYLAIEVESEGETLRVGIRKLGMARLKGLGEVEVYEIVDGSDWAPSQLGALAATGLMETLAVQFDAAAKTRRTPHQTGERGSR